ncbi:MAG TPA: hypothetical protein VG387_05050 [Rhizomicrobium sp.]|jgi:hypothetical protein|nr:hypothetical protein [Rhizomicrobium sp.]
MLPDSAETRALRLTYREWLFLGATIVFWGCYVLWLGKDTSWDFRNYHWYIPYAFLNGREHIDMLVAHQATYYNPFQDIPFYVLATHTPAWFALFVLGCLQGANVVPLYVLARQTLAIDEYKLGAAGLALLGQTGGLGLNMFGTTYHDNTMSILILSAIALLVVKRKALNEGPLWQSGALTMGAGFLVGMTVGLKLPEFPFAIGFAAALVALGGDWRHQLVRLVAGAIGGLIGVAAMMGYWTEHLLQTTGNPLFPYFNERFKSPLALPAPYRDMRFLPTTFWKAALFPILFTLNWSVADDIPFRDIRVMLAYVLGIVAIIVWLAGRRSKEPLVVPESARVILAFAAVSYLVWLKMFAIYRYIVALEMLGPLLIAIAIGLLPIPRRVQYVTLAVLFLAVAATTQVDYIERSPISDPFVQADVPKIEHPERAMVLLTGNGPLGFIAPSFPRKVQLLRIDGWMVQPQDGTKLTKMMKGRVFEWIDKKRDLYVLSDAYDMGRTRDSLTEYHLRIDWPKCVVFDTNIIGDYEFCPLFKWPRQ